MKFPDLSTFGKALGRWREMKRLKPEEVAKNSETLSRKSFGVQQVRKWESGRQGFPFKRLAEDIFPAYAIDDWDSFLDLCIDPDLEEIVPIKQSQREMKSSIYTNAHFTPPEILGNIRTRVDVLRIPPRGKTYWKQHKGHEFVLVMEGAVWCEFAKQEDGERKRYDLDKGDAIAFPGALYHQFGNQNGTESLLVVGRPKSSLPDGAG